MEDRLEIIGRAQGDRPHPLERCVARPFPRSPPHGHPAVVSAQGLVGPAPGPASFVVGGNDHRQVGQRVDELVASHGSRRGETGGRMLLDHQAGSTAIQGGDDVALANTLLEAVTEDPDHSPPCQVSSVHGQLINTPGSPRDEHPVLFGRGAGQCLGHRRPFGLHVARTHHRQPAATEIANPAISDRIVEVDPALGGRVLRVDDAVWKVLSERLGVAGTREEVLGRATLDARIRRAEDDPLTYVIRGVAPGGGDTATVRIAVNGSGVLNPSSESLTTENDVARCRWSFFDFDESARVTLTRTDTGACARVVITADEAIPTYAGEYQGTFDWAFPEAGFAATVPFTATVADDGTISLVYEWSGSYSPAEGVTIDISLEGSCEGTVDDQGVVACTGDFMGHTSWAGWADSPGVCSIDAVIDPTGALTGTISASSDLGGEGSFPLRGNRIGG